MMKGRSRVVSVDSQQSATRDMKKKSDNEPYTGTFIPTSVAIEKLMAHTGSTNEDEARAILTRKLGVPDREAYLAALASDEYAHGLKPYAPRKLEPVVRADHFYAILERFDPVTGQERGYYSPFSAPAKGKGGAPERLPWDKIDDLVIGMIDEKAVSDKFEEFIENILGRIDVAKYAKRDTPSAESLRRKYRIVHRILKLQGLTFKHTANGTK